MAESINSIIKNLIAWTDKRGWLVEMLKRNEIDEDIKQIYAATIEPGCVRGNHYHQKRVEWFFIAGGSAQICLEDIKTKAKELIDTTPEKPQRITINRNIAHAVKNISGETIYLFSAQNNIFDPQNPDTYEYQLIS